MNAIEASASRLNLTVVFFASKLTDISCIVLHNIAVLRGCDNIRSGRMLQDGEDQPRPWDNGESDSEDEGAPLRQTADQTRQAGAQFNRIIDNLFHIFQ